jgi:hypothetical protein
MFDLTQLISLVGAGLVLVAYTALQRGWWTSHAAPYLWCNLIGAVLLTAVALGDRRVGFILLEGVWASVTLLTILRRGLPADNTTRPV